MDPTYEAFLDYLAELSGVLDKLTAITQEKNAAARQGDLVKVDACMKQEQICSLSLRGMDKRRDKMLADMGLTGVTLSRLSEHYPEGMRRKAARAAEKALTSFEVYRSASNAARTTMEMALRDIDRMFPEGQRPKQEGPEDVPPPKMKTDFRA